MGSRNYPYNVRDDYFNVNKVPGLMDVTCSNEITDMTTNQTTLNSAIDALSASGYTYIASGLTWGWRMVSPDAPLSQGISYAGMKDPKTKTKKFVILMTDGENTRAPSYPAHDSGDTITANKLTADVCTNIKAMDIEVLRWDFRSRIPPPLACCRIVPVRHNMPSMPRAMMLLSRHSRASATRWQI